MLLSEKILEERAVQIKFTRNALAVIILDTSHLYSACNWIPLVLSATCFAFVTMISLGKAHKLMEGKFRKNRFMFCFWRNKSITCASREALRDRNEEARFVFNMFIWKRLMNGSKKSILTYIRPTYICTECRAGRAKPNQARLDSTSNSADIYTHLHTYMMTC